jgi:hypothetical protein
MTRLFRLSLRDSTWLLMILVVVGLLSYGSLCVKGAGDASMSVGEADGAVRQAFNATLDAEKAGANVSGLIVRLNEAGGFLGEAEVALNNGNSSEAANEANYCIEIAKSVQSDADALRASASNEAPTAFWTSVAFSAVSIAVFIVVLMLVWQRFKRKYIRKVLGSMPEVASDES